MRQYKVIFVLFLVVAMLAACNRAEHSMEAAPTAKGMIVSNVRANMTLPTDTGSFWMEITNNTEKEDALVGAKAEGCGVIELHETIMEKDVMTMRPVEGGKVPIAVGETIQLEPGGLHLMCIDKAAPLESGSTLNIVLHFTNAGDIQAEANVVAPGEEMPMDHSKMHGATSSGG